MQGIVTYMCMYIYMCSLKFMQYAISTALEFKEIGALASEAPEIVGRFVCP